MNDVDLSSQLNYISVCAGVGCLDLSLRIAVPESRTVCFVERESYAAALLVARMESGAMDQAPIWSDVTTFDGKAWRGKVDAIIGGFPCQPFSVAGKREGTEDERHLFPDIVRIAKESGAPIVWLENVPGLISTRTILHRGEIVRHLEALDAAIEAETSSRLRWYAQSHRDRLHRRLLREHGISALLYVLCELESAGYQATWGIFSAAEVGAPHRRERLFILAHTKDGRERERFGKRKATGARAQPGPQRRGGDVGHAGQQPRSPEQRRESREGSRRGPSPLDGSGTRESGNDVAKCESVEGRLLQPERRLNVADSGGCGERLANPAGSGREAGNDEPGAGEPALSSPCINGSGLEYSVKSRRTQAGSRRQKYSRPESEPRSRALANTPAPQRRQDERRGEKQRAVTGRSGEQLAHCRVFAACFRDATTDVPEGPSGFNNGRLLPACADCAEWVSQQCRDAMGNAFDAGLQERFFPEIYQRNLREQGQTFEPPGLGIFPPRPNERELWARILNEHPELAPAIEPGVCHLVDGPAIVLDSNRIDQLRALGNGVVPITAALAFTILTRKAGIVR